MKLKSTPQLFSVLLLFLLFPRFVQNPLVFVTLIMFKPQYYNQNISSIKIIRFFFSNDWCIESQGIILVTKIGCCPPHIFLFFEFILTTLKFFCNIKSMIYNRESQQLYKFDSMRRRLRQIRSNFTKSNRKIPNKKHQSLYPKRSSQF